ncbi:MAG: DUF4435 domain-containing protein [Spirochaetia bacterium]|jgi:hypothetical protein|nr:DUF4435 domain-containing protein [Spirochaetia bacterium]
MEEFITASRTANAIMQNTTFQGVYLLLEGKKDKQFYNRIIDSNKVKLKTTSGKENLREVIKILNSRSFKRHLGIQDADFSRLTDNDVNITNLFMTDDHDLEMMIIRTSAFDEVIQHFCDEDKIKDFTRKINTTIKAKVFELSIDVAYLKLANEEFNLGLKFKPKSINGKHLKYSKFICNKKFKSLGQNSLIETCYNYSLGKCRETQNKEIIMEKFNMEKKTQHDIYQLLNGHDVSNILFILIKHILKSTNGMLKDYNSIESSLILVYEKINFKKTDLYREIFKWASKRNITLFSNELNAA